MFDRGEPSENRLRTAVEKSLVGLAAETGKQRCLLFGLHAFRHHSKFKIRPKSNDGFHQLNVIGLPIAKRIDTPG